RTESPSCAAAHNGPDIRRQLKTDSMENVTRYFIYTNMGCCITTTSLIIIRYHIMVPHICRCRYHNYRTAQHADGLRCHSPRSDIRKYDLKMTDIQNNLSRYVSFQKKQ